MERLTTRKCGELLIKYKDGEYRSPCLGCESINKCYTKKVACGFYKALEKLEEYEDLEAQGKLPKLPCTVGDTVWYISDRIERQGRKKVTVSFPEKGTVDNITLGHMMVPQITVCNDEDRWTTFDSVEDLGKTVFLTSEEAEAALKQMEEKKV